MTNCEHCGQRLPTDENGRPHYRCAILLRAGRPPLSVRYCQSCWEMAAGRRAVNEYADLPLFKTGASG